MSTTTAMRMGSRWGMAAIRDYGYGTSEEHELWADLLLERVNARLPGSAQWLPSLSEIYYDVGDEEVEALLESGEATEALAEILTEEQARLEQEICDDEPCTRVIAAALAGLVEP